MTKMGSPKGNVLTNDIAQGGLPIFAVVRPVTHVSNPMPLINSNISMTRKGRMST